MPFQSCTPILFQIGCFSCFDCCSTLNYRLLGYIQVHLMCNGCVGLKKKKLKQKQVNKADAPPY